MPTLAEVVFNFVGVWPRWFSCLKEKGKKHENGSRMVYYQSDFFFIRKVSMNLNFPSAWEDIRQLHLGTPDGSDQFPSDPDDPQCLLV